MLRDMILSVALGPEDIHRMADEKNGLTLDVEHAEVIRIKADGTVLEEAVSKRRGDTGVDDA